MNDSGLPLTQTTPPLFPAGECYRFASAAKDGWLFRGRRNAQALNLQVR